MPTIDPTLEQIVRYGADAFVRLAHTATAAEDIQWEASPHAAKHTGHTPYNDPVYDIVTDPKREALREAMEAAKTQLLAAAEAARKANRDLYDAIEKWEGAE